MTTVGITFELAFVCAAIIFAGLCIKSGLNDVADAIRSHRK